jgi:hypothetical protein
MLGDDSLDPQYRQVTDPPKLMLIFAFSPAADSTMTAL